MAYDSSRGRSVLFGGGRLPGDHLGDTWEWDGSYWTQMADTGPPSRYVAAMVYDSARKVSLLFGGRNTDPLGDTWQWDGADWTQLADTGPSARSSTAMAFDSARNRTVLFAGQSSENLHLGDTWEFDGADWTQVQDVGPPPRGAHSMAYDSINDRVILFGGIDVNNGGLGDTWAWNGSEWAQVAEFGPAPRLNAAMAYAGGGNTMLFGGLNSLSIGDTLQIFGDTWEFDGKHWTQRQDIGPGALQSAAMAFDSVRSCVVLVGGLVVPAFEGQSDPVSGLTWEAPVPLAV